MNTEASPSSNGASNRARRRIGLGTKISGLLASVLLVTGVVTSIVVANQASSFLADEYRSKGVGIANSVAISGEEHMPSDNREALQRDLDLYREVGGVRYIAIIDAKGELLLHTAAGAFPPDILGRFTGLEKKLSADAEGAGMLVGEMSVPGLGNVLDINMPILGGKFGKVHVGMDLDEVADRSGALSLRVVLIFVIFIALGVALAIMAGRVLVRPAYEVQNMARQVAEGKLNVRADVRTADEFSLITDSFESMVSGLALVVSGVRQASVEVSDAAEEILASSQNQESGVAEQTASIEEVTASMAALAETARSIAGRSQAFTALAEQMGAQVRNTQSALGAAREAMDQIAERNLAVVTRISELYDQSRSILAVTDIISGISDRLDLLALNAALEGARVGDVGKGFSLVAQEMRRLAENVMNSTREVKDTIQLIHRAVQVAQDASHESGEATQRGVLEMQKMVDATQSVFSMIDQGVDGSRQILLITQQQLSSSQQMVAAMSDIATVSTQGLTSAQQITKAAQDLADLASVLRDQVSVFQLTDAEKPVATAVAAPEELPPAAV